MSRDGQTESPEWVVLGRIVRAQGLRGAVRVLPSGVEPDGASRLVGRRVFVRWADGVRETVLEAQRWQRRTWIVELRDCDTRDGAESLVGADLCLAEADRPELGPDEYYSDQLTGLRVVDAGSGIRLGIVSAVRPSAASDLLEVAREDGGAFLVPFVRSLVKAVDLPKGEIAVDLPDGLIDLNEARKGPP